MEIELLIPFRNIKLGRKFTTIGGIRAHDGGGFKRGYTCVKVCPMEIKDGRIANAVILLDHAGAIADDIGALTYFDRNDQLIVTVSM